MNFVLTKEQETLKKGLAILLEERGHVYGEGGISITPVFAEENKLKIEKKGLDVTISCKEKAHFFRGLGYLFQHLEDADFVKEVGIVSLMLCGDMPEERAYFYSRGLSCSGHVEFTMPEEQVRKACDPAQRYSLVTMRNARVGQVPRAGLETWESRVRYLRDDCKCPYPLYVVGGVLNGQMLREAKQAGVVGAYIGNVLMWNWDDEAKLFSMIREFEEVAEEQLL